MIPTWLEHAAAFVILWFALSLALAPFIGERLKGRAPMPPAPGDHTPPGCGPGAGPDPPEWEPDDQEAQRIAEMFAEAAAEEDDQHGLR